MLKFMTAFFMSLSVLSVGTISYGETTGSDLTNKLPTQGPIIHKLQMDCDSSKLLAINETISGEAPVLSVLFFTSIGRKLSTIDLTEPLKELISEDYDLNKTEVGCLEDKHGHGLKVPSLKSELESLHIQITTEGRVFEGYDHAGYTMLNAKKIVQ